MRRPLGLVASLAVIVTACAVPVDDEARLLDASDFGDANETQLDELINGVTTTAAPDLQVEDATNVILYFVGADGQLRTVQRPVPEPANIKQILDELEAGPSAIELEGRPNLTTAVLADLEAKTLGRMDEENDPDLLTIEVGPLLRDQVVSNPPRAREAVSQIVCTITNLTFKDNPTPIRKIAFIDTGGAPLSITDDAGAEVDSPFSDANFNNCEIGGGLPDPDSETTTTEP